MRNGIQWSLLILNTLGGCVSPPQQSSYQTAFPATCRDTERAHALNQEALTWAKQGEIEKAEAAFRAALAADLSFAPAHNNLGLILLQQKKLYEAALEFSYARKLSPRSLEPILNLARLYECVGWEKEAQEQYEQARKVDADYAGVRNGLARSDIPTASPASVIDPSTVRAMNEHGYGPAGVSRTETRSWVPRREP